MISPGAHRPFSGRRACSHAHLAHVEEVGDAVLVGEGPGLQAQLGGLDVLAGGVVVQDDGDLVLVKDLGEARLLKLGDGHRGGDVVAQHHVHLGLDELAHLHVVQPGVLGQDLSGSWSFP